MRVDGGVAGEGRVASVPKFDYWVKCTMASAQIGCSMLPVLWFILRGIFISHLGV